MTDAAHDLYSLQELDEIIKETIRAIEQGKERIFAIAETARAEYERVQEELRAVKDEAVRIIERVDELERKEKGARVWLAQVSRDFSKFSESQIKDAYEQAESFRVALQVERERERQVRLRRDDLEVRLRNLSQTVQHAEELVSQVGVAMDFLGGKLQNLSRHCETLKQKQEFAYGVIRAQEDERRRVARDIHDGPAQLLANVVLRVDLCQRLVEADRDKIEAELEQLKELVRHSLRDVRKIIYNLRPMALDDLGLIPALRTYLKDIQERSGLIVDMTLFGEEQRMAPSLEIALFRLVQEAVNNIIRHAAASRAQVKVEVGRSQVRIIVGDNGRGFDPGQTLGSKDLQGFGIIGMRERVELLGGEFRLESAPGQGSRVDVTIPLSQGKGLG